MGSIEADEVAKSKLRRKSSDSLQMSESFSVHSTTNGTNNRDDDAGAFLADFQNAPCYLRRDYVLTGYRVGGSYSTALQAMLNPFQLQLHNEFWNAWTMVLGVLFSTWCFVSKFQTLPASSRPTAVLLWTVVVTHFPFSFGLHSFIGISESARRTWRTLDVFMIELNSAILAIALGNLVFRDSVSFLGYSALNTSVFLFNVYTTMISRRIWNIPKKQLSRDIRNQVVIYLLPMIFQSLYFRDYEAAEITIATCIIIAIGGFLYANHIPERIVPGGFDSFGCSHNLMHICAIAAHYCEWKFLEHMAAVIIN
mmetsp:Transcript_12051/g.21807  ORF Transcript_12051/g.21807 Transcript_12051/m.21807 type:complete len:310 (+) Transcript_12051:207-1136(+)